jgi:hypothetical protein
VYKSILVIFFNNLLVVARCLQIEPQAQRWPKNSARQR